MATEPPILVTGAAGNVGAIGPRLTEMLIARGKKVRAMVRREDDRSAALAKMGAEVVTGDLLDLSDVHRVMEGCRRIYFSMSVSAPYLEATVNTAAVAKHQGVEAFVNISQMTVSQMSITETTTSPQQKQHWLAEQALNWSGLPVIHVRPTVFMDGFFLLFSAKGVREQGKLALPMGKGRTSPIAAYDVARVMTEMLVNPQPHIGVVYELTGPQSQDMDGIARDFSEALGRKIVYEDVPWEPWRQSLIDSGLPIHVVEHLATMARLNQQNRYDRMTDDVKKLTGQAPMSIRDFVAQHAEAFSKAS